MNKLSRERRAQILSMMVEGNSIRSIVRMTGVSKNTITKLLEDAGEACLDYHDRYMRGITAKRVQCDEIWSFAWCKQKNVAKAKRKDLAHGDIWTWVAIDAETKLVISYRVGGRDAEYAMALMNDLRQRVTTRLQLTTDGHSPYLQAVEEAFGADIDYAMLVKLYGEPPASPEAAKRYSPSECIGTRKREITGKPDPEHISTSYVERQNLTMRMAIRRFTRLTNAFSKKVENHAHSVAIHFMHYNFVRIHQSLRVTPAMAAGITPTLWSLMDLVGVIEEWEARHAPKLADRLVG
ncbi:MAG: DDE-type integrase/transposase/recombinase [Alphaproteobacteria bacterium]|nr:DDE-type integrase/transposase/recombinase [Alphaproteobacteria bacterium]